MNGRVMDMAYVDIALRNIDEIGSTPKHTAPKQHTQTRKMCARAYFKHWRIHTPQVGANYPLPSPPLSSPSPPP